MKIVNYSIDIPTLIWKWWIIAAYSYSLVTPSLCERFSFQFPGYPPNHWAPYITDQHVTYETRENLQVGLDILYDYCDRWKLTINTEKTSIIIFRKGGNVTQHDHLFFGDRRLNLLHKVSYLDLTSSSRGKFARTLSNLADRGLRAMFKLFRSNDELYASKPSFFFTLFDKLVKPVLLYRSESCWY